MIDTHIHLDEEAYAADREEMIARQQEEGVTAMIIPGVSAVSVDDILAICRKHPGLCFAGLGFHPQEVKADWKKQWAIIEKAIRANRSELVAIGEIGLDYYWDTTYKAEQQELLRLQLDLAAELDLPVMIHNRDATEDTLRILKEAIIRSQSSNRQLRGVVHCFNGSKETARQILEMGFYLGIGGVITFKNCKLADTLAELNQLSITRNEVNRALAAENHQSSIINRLVLETDGPYLAPVPYRGRRNESRLMSYVAERLAQVFDCSVEEIITRTTVNAKKLFGIK